MDWSEVVERFRGKRVAIVGSAPSCADNAPGFVDSHEVVVRIQNYKTGEGQGFRCDVHYAFYGTSVRNKVEDLKRDGVKLCMCKLPNSKPLHSDWHVKNNKPHGVDYRYIYKDRRGWWFCDTFIPDDERFLAKMRVLDGRQPTTGFAAILDVLECEPKSVFLTGFDFFSSGLHNLNEPWRPGNPADPIGHDPKRESTQIGILARTGRVTMDRRLSEIVG